MSKDRKQFTEAAVRDIRRRTRRKFSPEEKLRRSRFSALSNKFPPHSASRSPSPSVRRVT